MTFTDIRWLVHAHQFFDEGIGRWENLRTLQVLVDGRWIDVPEVRET